VKCLARARFCLVLKANALRVRARARESAKKVVTNQRNVHTPHLHRGIAVAFYCSLEIMEISTPYDLAIAEHAA
jgi:hypothetical protein